MKNTGFDYFIKCPYCRNIQFTLLPYYDNNNCNKKYGINTTDPDYRVVKNYYLPGMGNTCILKLYGYTFKKGTCCKITNINNKDIPCYNIYSTEITTPDGTIKTFCASHVKEVVKTYKLEIKENKILLKLKNKTEKEAQKALKVVKDVKDVKDVKEETILCVGCSAILKTGPRKGDNCGNKIFDNNLCKRHI
jgi:hypothetical protein